MGGERDLGAILKALSPRLYPERYSFAPTSDPALGPDQFALLREEEGLTVIGPDPAGEWARISLGAHSSLDAVGLTAVISRALAHAGISANVVAALHHDHIFVPGTGARRRSTACFRDKSDLSAPARI